MNWIPLRCLLALAGLLAAASAPGDQGPATVIESRDSLDTFRQGVKLFTDRAYVAGEVPATLEGLAFLRGSMAGVELTCVQAGVVYALTPLAERPRAASQETELVKLGFQKSDLAPFQLYGKNAIDVCCLYQKQLTVGERITLGKWTVLLFRSGVQVQRPRSKPWSENDGELLYNGIRLPRQWPPQDLDPQSLEPPPVPYLESPPAVIPIDVGRQLFVDDFLIADTTLTRRFHQAEKYAGNPVLKPETELERNAGRCPVACPFSDGVFYDPADKLFKMWYHAGWFDGTAYATSRDGLQWERPALDVVPGSNRVVAPRPDFRRDGVSLWLDHEAGDPAQRFKMFLYARSSTLGTGGRLLTSLDGVHWQERTRTSELGDNSTFFYNPFRKKWVFSIRSGRRQRTRDYWEHADFLAGAQWPARGPVFWLGADRLDPPDPAVGDRPQLYKIDAAGYESILLGMLQIHLGPENSVCSRQKTPKLCELKLGFSRDGFHWDRSDRQVFIAATRKAGDWERAYVHSAGGVCLVVGDKLYFYYGAWSGISPALGGDMYAGASTGLATLRRDGFASMEAGPEGGTLTTRPVTFRGKYLFVNADATEGELRAEVLDEQGRTLPPFSRENCLPLRADKTLLPVAWNGGSDLSALVGKVVRFRFHLTGGKLYAFWVSPDRNGASFGFVAAGGPGLTGPCDTQGSSAVAPTPLK